MNTNQFKNAFKNAKFNMGLGPFLLAGLGLLALKSYYYGNPSTTQSMSATTPSSLTKSPAHSPRKYTGRASTSKSHS
jgi:hypothetical protein